jgi:hypothetical protein
MKATLYLTILPAAQINSQNNSWYNIVCAARLKNIRVKSDISSVYVDIAFKNQQFRLLITQLNANKLM